MDIKWQTKTLAEFSSLQLFEILKLRQAIFVVEQACAYADIDSTDSVAMHLCGYIMNDEEQHLAAYARLIRPGVTYDHASIGRVAVDMEYRGSGLGRLLMQRAIEEVQSLYPGEKIKIGAQEQLEHFYHELGFATVSKPYLEDGISHIDMLKDSLADWWLKSLSVKQTGQAAY